MSIFTGTTDKRVYAVQAHLSNFTNYTKSGYSGAIPMDTTIFETDSTMHDPTVSDSGTATGTQTTTTLQDTSKSWTVNQYTNFYVRTLAGTGLNRWRKITSNTSDTLTVSGAWVVTPVSASTTYEITEFSTRLVAPIDGIYIANAQTGFEKPTVANSTYGIRFDVNGSFKSVLFQENNGNTEHEIQTTKAFELSANDYVEFQVYQAIGEVKMYGSSRMHFSLIKQ